MLVGKELCGQLDMCVCSCVCAYVCVCACMHTLEQNGSVPQFSSCVFVFVYLFFVVCLIVLLGGHTYGCTCAGGTGAPAGVCWRRLRCLVRLWKAWSGSQDLERLFQLDSEPQIAAVGSRLQIDLSLCKWIFPHRSGTKLQPRVPERNVHPVQKF